MKILAIGFHQGMLDSIVSVLTDEVDSVITKLVVSGTDYDYNLTEDMANAIWQKEQDYFNRFDLIITTDTAILSRIFIPNYEGRVIVDICNRYDYWWGGNSDIKFTTMLQKTMPKKNIQIVSYSKFDKIYAERAGIYVDDVIKPVFRPTYHDVHVGSTMKYYIPDYQNNHTFSVAEHCKGVNVVTGRHGGIGDIAKFKAVIHLPYHWQGVAEQESLSVGTPYYVPSKKFFFELLNSGKYWFQDMYDAKYWIDICNFYDKENEVVFYFDSWEDIHDIDIDLDVIYAFANKTFNHYQNKWRQILWN
jgi:hypothetical protein